MRITPLDVRKQEFRRVVRGLDPDEVHAFLATVADEYEAVLTDNKQLREKVIELDEKVTEYRNMERTLRDTLLTAERVMTESKESAQREAALLIREAELTAQRATARISQEVARLRRELAELRRMKDAYLGRLRWLMRGHLEMIEGHAQEFAEADAGLGLQPDPEATRPPRDGRGPSDERSGSASPSRQEEPVQSEAWRGEPKGGE